MSIMINHRGVSYIMELLSDENLEEAYTRLWRVIQHKPTDEVIFDKLINISKMWYYKNRLNCQYSELNEQSISLF